MIRALQRLVRFAAWIVSRDKLESDAEDPGGSGQRWLLAREELPEPPPTEPPRDLAGSWRRFFLTPERLDHDAVSQPTNGPPRATRSFLRELFAVEPLGPAAEEEPTPRSRGFLQQLLAREHLGAPETGGKPTTRPASTTRFLRWLFSPETIDRNGRIGRTGSIEAPLSRRS